MAREFGLQGIHVAYIIIYGEIETNGFRNCFPRPTPKKRKSGFLILKKSQKPTGSFIFRNAVPGPRKWISDPGWSISDFILKLFLYKNLFIIPALSFLTV